MMWLAEKLFDVLPPSEELTRPPVRPTVAAVTVQFKEKSSLNGLMQSAKEKQLVPGNLSSFELRASEGEDWFKKSEESNNCSLWHICKSMCATIVFVLILLIAVGFQAKPPEDGCIVMEALGFTCEEHEIWTDDGVRLSLKRIRNTGKPILLIHGISDSFTTFILR